MALILLALIALGAIGHAILWVTLINRVQAVDIPRGLIDSMTVVFLFAIVLVPPAIGWAPTRSTWATDAPS